MEPSSNGTPRDLKILNDTYSFTISKDINKLYTFYLTKELDKTYFERKFSLKDLEKESPFWLQMKNEQQFEDLIESNIREQSVESYLKESLILVFVVKYEGKFKLEFPISLEKKDKDVSQLFNQYGNCIQRLENKVDMVVKDIETKFNRLEEKLTAYNKAFLNGEMEKIEKKRGEEKKNDVEEYRQMKNEIFRDVSILTILKSSLQNSCSKINEEVEFLYSPFLAAQDGNANSILSNGNYTYNRNTGNWYGMKCKNVEKNNGKFVFSVKFDSYGNACMLGFCISNKVNISAGTGYYNSGQSFMFYIASNHFYNKGAATQYSCFIEVPKVGDIFSVFIDTKNKISVLYYNGKQLSIPKPIAITDDEKIYIAPCVDMQGSQTTVTLVDFREITL